MRSRRTRRMRGAQSSTQLYIVFTITSLTLSVGLSLRSALSGCVRSTQGLAYDAPGKGVAAGVPVSAAEARLGKAVEEDARAVGLGLHGGRQGEHRKALAGAELLQTVLWVEQVRTAHRREILLTDRGSRIDLHWIAQCNREKAALVGGYFAGHSHEQALRHVPGVTPYRVCGWRVERIVDAWLCTRQCGLGLPPRRGTQSYHEHGLAEYAQDGHLAQREIHATVEWQEDVPHPHSV